MSSAGELIDTIRTQLRPLHDKIIGHPYVAAVECAKVSQQSLGTFAIQQHHIIASDLRSIALLLARHGDQPSRPYLLNVLQGENSAYEALTRFAQAIGIGQEKLRESEPIAAAFAYSAFLAWLGVYGSDAEMAGALSLNFDAWGANCTRLSSALKANYGLELESVAFFDLFANLPRQDPAAVVVIQNGLDRGISSTAIARAARMLQSYELMYWDAMADAASA
jgi:pyrroloquinoline quinone (PQQ) biosynthesis protein C